MDQVTTEIRNKIKSAVKAKLQEIGAYVDEELPDYIMVMIANRRSKAQMNSELSLFLGGHTEKFTDWLHSVLEKLESFAMSNNTTDTLKAAVSSIPKTAPAPTQVPQPAEAGTKLTAAIQPLSSKVSENANETPQTYKSVDVHSTVYKDKHSIGDMVHKDNLYVPMPISQLPRANVQQPALIEDDMDDADTLNIEGDQEYRPEEKPVKKELPSRSSLDKQDRSKQKRRHASAVEEREIKRFAQERRNNRSHRYEGRLSSRLGSVVRPAVHSQIVVKPVERRPRERSRDHEEVESTTNPRSGVTSVVRVTARRKLPARLQPTNSLILKAVADAQKSIASRPAKVLEVETEPKALFTRKYRERANRTAESQSAIPAVDNSPLLLPQSAIKQEDVPGTIENEEMEGVEEQPDDSCEQSEDVATYPAEPQGSRVETRFVVTLDGAHALMNRVFEDDLNDEDSEVIEPLDTAGRKPVRSRLYRRRSTGSEAETHQPLERCKFWPNCRQGDRCNFHHPKTPCKTFPNCSFGDGCLFIHPHCKFDLTCNRPSCPYLHTVRPKAVATPPVVPAAVSARSPPVVHGKTVCKFFPACNNVNCGFFHPPACKYGSNCTRVGCTFHHPSSSLPSPSKLKWAPIKTK